MERAVAVGLPERVASVEEILWHRDDYGMITLPDEVDGHRVRVGCDVVAIQDVQDSLAAFGDRYLRAGFTRREINTCRGINRVYRHGARCSAKEAVIKAFA